MDAGKLFVLLITAFSVGILIHLELKSRRRKRQIQRPADPGRSDSNCLEAPYSENPYVSRRAHQRGGWIVRLPQEAKFPAVVQDTIFEGLQGAPGQFAED
jgi:hypothetical protein